MIQISANSAQIVLVVILQCLISCQLELEMVTMNTVKRMQRDNHLKVKFLWYKSTRGTEVKKRVQAWWSGCRRVSGVICDRRMSAKTKGNVYQTETSYVIWTRDGGSAKESEGRVRCGGIEDAEIFVGSNKDGQDKKWAGKWDSTSGTVQWQS